MQVQWPNKFKRRGEISAGAVANFLDACVKIIEMLVLNGWAAYIKMVELHVLKWLSCRDISLHCLPAVKFCLAIAGVVRYKRRSWISASAVAE